MTREPLTCIDIFSGCGGASLGFMLKGFQIVAAVDNDESACKTYRNNLDVEPIVDDITKLSGRDILRNAEVKRGEPTVLIGCPPCQGFSRLRKKKFDKRNKLVYKYLDTVRSVHPKFVLFENVPGIMEVAEGAYFNSVCNGLYSMGYGYTTAVLDAVNYGVPQFRRRVILLATRMRHSFSRLRLPRWTHCNPAEAGKLHLSPWTTVRDAIQGLPKISAGQHSHTVPNHEARDHAPLALERIKAIPRNGGSRKDLNENLWLECHKLSKEHVGYNDVYGRLRWDTPAVTVTSGCTNPTKGRFLHPSQNRAITTREAARLQSFPDCRKPIEGFSRDFIFSGSRDETSRQVGNALPVRLSKAMADTIAGLAP